MIVHPVIIDADRDLRLNHGFEAEYCPFRFRGHYYDTDTGLYYIDRKYYDSTNSLFVTPCNFSELWYNVGEVFGGVSRYALPGGSADSLGIYAPGPLACLELTSIKSSSVNEFHRLPKWMRWVFSGFITAAGVALCFIPGAQGIGMTLAISGFLGLLSNIVSAKIGRVIGGISSISNGGGAISTGIALLGLGIPGLIGGIALILVGAAAIILGANEILTAATDTNYVQKWTHLSDTGYGWMYLGVNVASSLGQIAGRGYYLHKTREVRIGHSGKIRGYRYKDFNGNYLYDFDYPSGKIRYNHYHGIPGGKLAFRTGQHWRSYLRLIWWMMSGG